MTQEHITAILIYLESLKMWSDFMEEGESWHVFIVINIIIKAYDLIDMETQRRHIEAALAN